MGKRRKISKAKLSKKIPKNKDIEEIVEKEENKVKEQIKKPEKIATKNDAMSKLAEKRQSFLERYHFQEKSVNNKTKELTEEQRKSIEIKMERVNARKDAQERDFKREIELIKIISRIEQNDQER